MPCGNVEGAFIERDVHPLMAVVPSRMQVGNNQYIFLKKSETNTLFNVQETKTNTVATKDAKHCKMSFRG